MQRGLVLSGETATSMVLATSGAAGSSVNLLAYSIQSVRMNSKVCNCYRLRDVTREVMRTSSSCTLRANAILLVTRLERGADTCL